MSDPQKPGRARGQWFVVGQFALLLGIMFAPLLGARAGTGGWWNPVGAVVLIIGLMLFAFGSHSLGRKNLTALPEPKEESVLIEHGAFELVRHPIYGGLMLVSLGWSIYAASWISLVFTLMLVVLLEFKSRLEEAWLLERYRNYASYQTRTKKFLPWIW
jgi:protein-S-isoprenylcysteine O-methyltransferase Ste14